ncbi:cation/H(+) antiporter 15-like [Impatiens glandulifera]|uniref:cation/H(+) antiporter 15-like n=1 Tax=Impatiens glandulifera TaxID=253017 RepID=UPI001FB18EB7|nr:cation/H(+) antiporter 15-like [Impatiens glandulifera]
MSVNTSEKVVCYMPGMITTNGLWQGDNPLNYSLPLFILQLSMIVITTRILFFILKPFRQPRVVAEILGGVILGPSCLGQIPVFATTVFPLRSVMVLETVANIGLLYFLFLVGVEMDLLVVHRTGKKALAFAISSMVLPFVLGIGFSYIVVKDSQHVNSGTFILFLGISLSVTAFPVLARILAELKLLNTDMGKIAMSAAVIMDVFAWIVLAIAIAMAENKSTTLATLRVLLSSTAFVFFCIFIIRPLLHWIIRRTPEGESIKEVWISLILTGVMVSGFVTDAIGTHSVFGAFVFGLVIPNGPLGLTLIEKLEDFVSGLLLPLFFAMSGLKTDIMKITGVLTWIYLALVIVLCLVGKVVGTLITAMYYQMPFYEGVTLGLLMNSKGLVEIIVLNVGKDQNVLDDKSFALMVTVAIVMTASVIPMVSAIYKPTRRSVSYKRRSIETSKQDAELRVLACIHTPRNVPTIISLLEASHPSKRSPICIYVLHMVELTGRASAMIITHNTRKVGRPAMNNTQAQSDHIIHAFQNFEQHADSVSVHPLTAISPYSTMHEDICEVAQDKRVAFIIIPFHKQQTVDGGMDVMNPAFRTINQNILNISPCTVGILIDRGLNSSARLAVAGQTSHQILVLYFGGPDDREALAYAWRMSGHPGITLTVIQFISGDAEMETVLEFSSDSESRRLDEDREKQRDKDFVNDFRGQTANDESVTFVEQMVSNAEETVAVIRSIDAVYDLFIVGRGQGPLSHLTAGLTEWSECPELGAIGDLLASSDFHVAVSVLVVQQYVGSGTNEEGGGGGLGSPDGPHSPVRQQNMHYNNFAANAGNNWQQQQPPPRNYTGGGGGGISP